MNQQDPKDPVEFLRNANPVANEGEPSVEPAEADMALFEEITMNDANTATRKARRATTPAREPLWRRPGAIALAGAFTVAVVTAGVLVLPGEEQSAYAAVVEAAERAADTDSGRVEVVIDLDEVEGEGITESGTVELTFAYDGDDSSTVMSGDTVSEPARESDVPLEIEFRTVDGQEYMYAGESDEERWIALPESDDLGVSSMPGDVFRLSAEQIDPSTMLELVSSAQDVEKVGSADGSVTYRGTVLGADIEAIDQAELPAGISLIASDGGNLPDEVMLTVVVVDDELSSVVLDADGEFAGNEFTGPGYVDATITTTYLELGEPQNIEAPPADQVDEDAFFPGGFAEEMQSSLDVLDELDERRPGLCDDATITFEEEMEATLESGVGDLEFNDDSFEAFNDAMVACFNDAGEPQAAEAFEAMSAFSD